MRCSLSVAEGARPEDEDIIHQGHDFVHYAQDHKNNLLHLLVACKNEKQKLAQTLQQNQWKKMGLLSLAKIQSRLLFNNSRRI